MTDSSRALSRQIFKVDDAYVGMRLDKALCAFADDLSRARVQTLISDGQVTVSGATCETASRKLKTGDTVTLIIPPLKESVPQPENIPLDVVYEDDDLLVINKPVGLVVHPGAGNHDGTLVNALLHHCGDSLSGIGGVMRPGIVHRLDKETSGLMVVAKHDKAHQGLSDQLQDRSLSRQYQALVLGVPMPPKGAVDLPIGRDSKNRQKMAINPKQGKEAKTHYKVDRAYSDALSLLICRLESGRTHQIRVHMQAIKHPLIGDPVYGSQPTAVAAALKKAGCEKEVVDFVVNFPHQALHAFKIGFIHPVLGEEMSFTADMPNDVSKLLKMLG